MVTMQREMATYSNRIRTPNLVFVLASLSASLRRVCRPPACARGPNLCSQDSCVKAVAAAPVFLLAVDPEAA